MSEDSSSFIEAMEEIEEIEESETDADGNVKCIYCGGDGNIDYNCPSWICYKC